MAKKNDVVEIIIDKVDFPNRGRGTYEGQTVKFKGGIKGQKVKVRVGKIRNGIIEAKVLEVLEKSPIETEVGCSHFGICGGCAYQSISYENELKLKEDQVRSLFVQENLEINLLGIEPSPIVGAYRNKMEYTFGDEVKDGPLSVGLHMKGRFYEIINVGDCNIIDNDFTLVRETVRNFFEEKKQSFYKTRQRKGLLRHLVVRKALSSGEILINLVTTSQEVVDKEALLSKLLNLSNGDGSFCLEGKIAGVLHTTNDGLGDVVKADKLELLYGRDYITEEILGLKFKISPFSFFQTNTIGAEKLYSIVRDFTGDIDDKVVFDLYSGTGTIAQIMAPVAKKVIGIEIVEEAVETAKDNAELNKLNNIEFIAGDVLLAVDNLTEKPDLIVLDPPREGIHPKAINKIIDFNPETFVYVSCNPITLVRDLRIFKERGYEVKKAKLMDMFPRTPHVETVVLMSRKDK